jgi:hypothetical protein
MATTLEKIRLKIEDAVNDAVTNESVIEWCNDAQSEIMMAIDIPDSATLSVNTTDLSYPLVPTNIKRINRLWLSSERSAGVDRDINVPYRIYDGSIVFAQRFGKEDTLNIEYYRHLTYFTAITQNIDIDDRYATLYSSYGIAQYYDSPKVIERLGELPAQRQYDKHYGRHMNIRNQISAQYLMEMQPSTIKEAY